MDCWIRGKSLRELIEGPLNQHEADMMVVELLGGQGQRWRWERLSFELPQEVKDQIKDKTCPLCKNQPKTIENLLRECDFARNFWHLMSVPPDAV